MIDKTSLEILKILQEKARIPNIDVSRQVGLAPSAVLERVKKMEKTGIIDGYEVTLNPKLFHRSMIAYTYVSVDPTKESEIGKDLAAIPDIQEVHFISGNDCFLTKVRCKDQEALGDIIKNKIKTIEGVIKTKSEIVLSTNKETSRFPLPQSV
ncbi:MAG: Lrp/AsnC family leucine-responsive transcriptional regulator [Desulforhopalus sp.]|jgi:Lrp/AsnC family leucine-responsive transcriptional regulator